jgi:NADH-quinone oxidoreductase subunit J
MVEVITFAACAIVVLAGAIGVIASRNPVHAALSLVATLFGVAVLFLQLQADLLAAVQVIVYAGAIVILFLFVIMLLGVDRSEDLSTEPIGGQRPLAVVAGVGILGASLVALLAGAGAVTGRPGAIGAITEDAPNIEQVAEVLFTDYIAAFQITGILLTIAVVAAVVLVRRPPADLPEDPNEQPEPDAEEPEAEAAPASAAESGDGGGDA